MTPSVFSSKLAAVMLREWGRTFPARGKVTRPPTAKEYIASLVWLPTLLGGPVRHWREVRVSFRKQAFFGGGGVRGGGGGDRVEVERRTRKNSQRKITNQQAPFASATYFIGGFLPLWLQDMLLSWSGGLIMKKSK